MIDITGNKDSGDWRKCKVVRLADGVGSSSRWQALSTKQSKRQRGREAAAPGMKASRDQATKRRHAKRQVGRQLEQGRRGRQ